MIKNIFGKQKRPRRVPHVIDAQGRSYGPVKVKAGGFVVVPIEYGGRATEGSSGGMAAAHAIAAKHGLRIEYR